MSLVAHHAEEACRILKSSFVGPAAASEPTLKIKKSPPPAKKSPKQTKAKASAKPAAARRGATTKSTRNIDPVTPRHRKGVLLLVSN